MDFVDLEEDLDFGGIVVMKREVDGSCGNFRTESTFEIRQISSQLGKASSPTKQ